MQELDLENNSIWIDIQNLYEKYAFDIDKIKQRYKLNIEKTFNIFSTISDQYQKENLHSDIIRAIIGQDSDCFKSEYIMKEFLKFIGLKSDEIFSNISSLVVQREYSTLTNNDNDKGRVDLLIYDDTKAIIIENKINGAPDMDTQLAKYYEQLKNEEKKVLKIVYLTLNDSEGPKNLGQYGKSYQKYLKNIKEKLICISAVSDNKKKSFSDFLRELKLEQENNRDVKKVFLEQYCQLLDSLGGSNLMTDTEEKCLEEILNDENMIHKVNNFIEIWDKRFEFVGKKIFSRIQSEKKYFEKENLRDWDVLDYKIPGIEEFYIYYSSPVQIGFYLNDNKNKEKLKNILSSVKDESEKANVVNWKIAPSKDPNYWLYMTADSFEAKKYDEIENHILMCLDNLVKKTEEEIK